MRQIGADQVLAPGCANLDRLPSTGVTAPAQSDKRGIWLSGGLGPARIAKLSGTARRRSGSQGERLERT
jgi:hypothetical protein